MPSPVKHVLIVDLAIIGTGVAVPHVGAGTGEALNVAGRRNVDTVLVHAKSLEEKLVAKGFGTECKSIGYYDCLRARILGGREAIH